jgi:hypothetical protein
MMDFDGIEIPLSNLSRLHDQSLVKVRPHKFGSPGRHFQTRVLLFT